MENLGLSLLLISPEPTNDAAAAAGEAGLRARTWFQWGGTISAIILLILNRPRQRSRTQTSLLVTYLLSSLPTVLFNNFRGEIGYWVAFLAVASHLFLPHNYFPESHLLLFVVTPSWVVQGLHESILGGILCLVIGLFLVIEEIRSGISTGEGCGGSCDLYFFLNCLGISFLFFFTILYLWMGPW